jgi:hypothetical protein
MIVRLCDGERAQFSVPVVTSSRRIARISLIERQVNIWAEVEQFFARVA